MRLGFSRYEFSKCVTLFQLNVNRNFNCCMQGDVIFLRPKTLLVSELPYLTICNHVLSGALFCGCRCVLPPYYSLQPESQLQYNQH